MHQLQLANNRESEVINSRTMQSKRDSYTSSIFADSRPKSIAQTKFINNERHQLSNQTLQRKLLYFGLEIIDVKAFLISLNQFNEKEITLLSEKLMNLSDLLEIIIEKNYKNSPMSDNLKFYKQAVPAGTDEGIDKTKYPKLKISSVCKNNHKLRPYGEVIDNNSSIGVLIQLLFITNEPLETFIDYLCKSNVVINMSDEHEAIKILYNLVKLYELHIISMYHKTMADKTLEMQALNINDFIFVTSNPKNFIRGKLNPVTFSSVKKKGIHFVSPNLLDISSDTHAEIILLANLVLRIFETQKLTQYTVYLGGIKPPCGKCRNIINKFLSKNNNVIKLEFIDSALSNAFDMNTSRSESNVATGGDTYQNAFALLKDRINQESIDDKYPSQQANENENSIKERLKIRQWLLDMLGVIDFDPSSQSELSIAPDNYSDSQ